MVGEEQTMSSSSEDHTTSGNTWQVVGTLDDKEITRTGRGIADLFATLEQTFGLGPAWVNQVPPDLQAMDEAQPRAIQLVWSFCPEDIWLTAALSAAPSRSAPSTPSQPAATGSSESSFPSLVWACCPYQGCRVSFGPLPAEYRLVDAGCPGRRISHLPRTVPR